MGDVEPRRSDRPHCRVCGQYIRNPADLQQCGQCGANVHSNVCGATCQRCRRYYGDCCLDFHYCLPWQDESTTALDAGLFHAFALQRLSDHGQIFGVEAVLSLENREIASLCRAPTLLMVDSGAFTLRRFQWSLLRPLAWLRPRTAVSCHITEPRRYPSPSSATSARERS